MKKDYPLEALLRPPVELWSAFVAAIAGIMAIAAPSLFMLTPSLAYATGAIMFCLAAYRFKQGMYIVRYHRNLKSLPIYELTSEEMPYSHKRLFLGKGFRWSQKYTQRLRDTLRPASRRFLEPGKLYHWARAKEQDWEHSPFLGKISKHFSTRAWWNPVPPLPPVGGTPAIHGVCLEEHDVWMNLGERVGHTIVLGTTRVGKTRLCELLVTQDIHRGDIVVVFDPKGDADMLKRMYAEARSAGREENFYLFHLGYPEISARYNSIGSFSRISEVATRISNQLPGDGDSAAFREFGWRFVNIIAKALVALGRRPDYQQITQHVTNIEPLLHDYCKHWLPTVDPQWELNVKKIEMGLNERNIPMSMRGRQPHSVALIKYVKDRKIFDPVIDGLRSAFEYEKSYFDKLVVTLMPFLEKITTGKMAELISPNYFDLNDPRPIFDWMQVIRRKGIVYVGLDALSDFTVAGAVGNSMFADLVSVSGQIYKFGTAHGLHDADATRDEKPTVNLHCDEFNELIGDEFIPLLNKAGGSGMQVTAYTQTWSDVQAKVGNESKAGQIAGNFNTMIMMRVREKKTAEMLTEHLPKVEIATLTIVTSVNDSAEVGNAEFTSRNEDRLSVQENPMLLPSEVIELPKGQAFAVIEGGQLYKIRLPLPKTSPNDDVPETIELVSDKMAKKYRSSDHWWSHGGDATHSHFAEEFQHSSPWVPNMDDETDEDSNRTSGGI